MGIRSRVGVLTDRSVMALVLFAAALSVVVLLPRTAPGPAQAQVIEGKRVALVIGNSKYRHVTPLNNPGNDARAMARVLSGLGFDVIAREDLELRPMLRALADFSQRMGQGSVALFYYSGHGIQVDGRNYLVPLDADLPAHTYVASDTVDLTLALDYMNRAQNRLNIVILDACRDNPFARRWTGLSRGSPTRGLAPTIAPPGTVIAYATDPGDRALDGDPGGNGVYTAELLRFLPQPGLRLDDVFKRVYESVYSQTNGQQQPWIAQKFSGDFYFTARVAPPAAPPPPPAPSRQEIAREVGILSLSASLPGVDVWVNDRKVWTSLSGGVYTLFDVPVGTHRVVGRKDGHREWSREVRVAADQRTEIVVDIEPIRPTGVASTGPDDLVARIAALDSGGSSDWDSAVRKLLVAAYDANGSGLLDTAAEVDAVPCPLFRAMDTSIRSGRGTGSLSTTYGFAPAYSYVGEALGFSKDIRAKAVARLGQCGVSR